MLRHNKLTNGLQQIVDKDRDQMFMDVYIFKGIKGETLNFYDKSMETALLLLEGEITFHVGSESFTCARKNVFNDAASALHFSCVESVDVEVLEDCEILVQKANNTTSFPYVFYNKENIDKQVFGDGPLRDTTMRIVTTLFDYERAPYSNMVLGEIINHPGIWSSYPPHSHPQPEVYFYKFSKPQGFGTCFIGEDAYKITHNSVAMLTPNKTHPQNAAPGYAMYYVWMIPHLKDQPWEKTRIMDKDHTWLLEDNPDIIKL